MRYLTALAVFLSIASPGNAETLTQRRISSQDIGTLVFMAPEAWQGSEHYDDLEAATVYELSARKNRFSLRISVKSAGLDTQDGQAGRDDAVIARLDAYLDYIIAEYGPRAVPGEFKAARFSDRNHGIYARLTLSDPGKEQLRYLTHGARIVGDNFVVFSLSSNDKDLSILRAAVDVIASFKVVHEFANAPDSYLCHVDQLTGFGIVEGKWDAISTDKVKHNYLVRRSRQGDDFADSSEWVFTAEGGDDTDTSCDNEAIGHGVFRCSGPEDEEFRMDSRTLRFIYVYLGGYHDVPPNVIPDEESPRPQIEIGTCEAR